MFFTSISKLTPVLDIKFSVAQHSEEKLKVNVFFSLKEQSETVSLVPISIIATPQELDSELVEAIKGQLSQVPSIAERVNLLLNSLKDVEKSTTDKAKAPKKTTTRKKKATTTAAPKKVEEAPKEEPKSLFEEPKKEEAPAPVVEEKPKEVVAKEEPKKEETPIVDTGKIEEIQDLAKEEPILDLNDSFSLDFEDDDLPI